jgi:ribosomal protein L3 glutamine methyltransferase
LYATPMTARRTTTVGQLIEAAGRRLAAGGVVCAQGTSDPEEEAAFLVMGALGLPYDDPATNARLVAEADAGRVAALVAERIERRRPAAYLLGHAWFAGLRFEVNEDVLIPRSPFAELIATGFEPWLRLPPAPRILEIGTGSGCIAVACALAFPEAEIIATDISAAALAVAARNVATHGVAGRVRLLEADLYAGIAGRFDLIVTNPPYVPDGELRDPPPEFAWEPRGALVAGPDGLALVRRILQDAAHHLEADGWLAIEVGGGGPLLERLFPDVPFIWPEFAHGGDGIALVGGADLTGVRDRRARGH